MGYSFKMMMENLKTGLYFFLIMLYGLLLTNCDSRKPSDKEKSREILSSRTLGLAYLEENKLNEAETEFLKLIDLAPDEALGHANLGLVYLRMGEYEKAEKNLLNAIELQPDDPDIQLILAKVYELMDDDDKALEVLQEINKKHPDHPKTLYALVEYYETANDAGSLSKKKSFLSVLTKEVPENLVARILYIETLIQSGDSDEAIAQLEDLVRIFPDFPDEANTYYDQTIDQLREGNEVGAFTSMKIFHNFFKVSSPYQAGIQELKGPGGELIGFPLITLGESTASFWFEGEDLLEAIRFTDVTATVGLDQINESVNGFDYHTNLALSDYDGDGDLDVYFGRFKDQSANSEHFLFQNNMGSYSEVSAEAGLDHSGPEKFSLFGDFDNDGFLDLFIITTDRNLLYRNTDKNEFEDVAEDVSVQSPGNGNMTLFLDYDHDGDLDLFIGTSKQNAMYRNNGDASFTNVGVETGTAEAGKNTADACFGDFDDDGDLDLFMANTDGGYALLDNRRQGRFENITVAAGLQADGRATSVAAGDYNNDGYLDLIIVRENSNGLDLYRNKGDGTFERDGRSDESFRTTEGMTVRDICFVDFDNDGFEDIILGGEPLNEDENGLLLLHNDSLNIFKEVSHLLPEQPYSIQHILPGDFNEDGDQDIYLGCTDGTLRLLRNDGGNANHYLKLQLVGVRTGSSKNNYFGIGSKVEVRAGDLYQMKVVTQPDMHFGLGDRSGADVVRILWTNGTPQNIFTPRSNQDLIEEQELKGSCPFLYTWNGHEYVFVKDMMWRSALGMPLGIMGDDKEYAFPDASREYLRIPGELLQPKDGSYSLQITSELWETMYYDELYLVAVDHPRNINIYVDEKFLPPPFPTMELYQIGKRKTPVQAVDEAGRDLLPYINQKDDEYIANFKLGTFQGITEMKEIILDLGEDIQEDNIFLYLDGWIFPTDASINEAISQSDKIKAIAPYLQVLDQNRNWVTIEENIGFPLGKNKTIIVDLSNKFLSDDHKVKIRTNMQIYWDHIFFGEQINNQELNITKMIPSKADLHYRGFSRTYRKGGRYGPHWFDYNSVSRKPKWIDLEGRYTRYGDVLPLLLEPDNKYIIANAGDEITIEFEAEVLPKLPEGWKRDFLVYSVGWVKDGDLNTAHGQTVEPLPFHGMSSYPYGDAESYPSDPEFQDYMDTYNIREITSERFRRAVYDLY